MSFGLLKVNLTALGCLRMSVATSVAIPALATVDLLTDRGLDAILTLDCPGQK
jgi:hypothetical protein